MNIQPDYTSYSEAQLLDAKANIDAEAYPENYQRLISEIEARDIDLSQNAVSFSNISTFERVGNALIAIGIIDLLFILVFNFMDSVNYSSNFNIFAIIIGYLITKGSIRTVSFTRWLSIFLIVTYIFISLSYLFLMPMDLAILYVKLVPIRIFFSILLTLIFLAVAFWVYITLSNEESREELSNHGYNKKLPKSAPISSVLLIIIAAVYIYPSINSDNAEYAISLAKQNYGEEYKYHINTITVASKSDKGRAVVTVYNSEALQYVEVKW